MEARAHPLTGLRLRVEPPGLLVAPPSVVTIDAQLTGLVGLMYSAPLLTGVGGIAVLTGLCAVGALADCVGVRLWLGRGESADYHQK